MIQGTFYRYELQKIDKSETDSFKIEQNNQKKENKWYKTCFVKWLGWPSKFNSWIPEKDVEGI